MPPGLTAAHLAGEESPGKPSLDGAWLLRRRQRLREQELYPGCLLLPDLRGGSDYCLYLQEIPEWFPSHFAASGNTGTHNPSGRLVPGPRDTRCSPQISLLPDPASQHRWGESLKWPTLPLHPSSPHGRGSQYLPELPTVACAFAESCKWYRNKMQHVKAASLFALSSHDFSSLSG